MSLRGKRILVTRAAEDRGPFEALLVHEGAVPVAFPCIAIADVPEAAGLAALVGRLRPDFVVVASAHVARRLVSVLPALSSARLAAVGKATAEALFALGRKDVVVPESGVGAEAIAAALAPEVRGRSVLVPRAEGGNRALVEGLEAAGARVETITLYRTVTPDRPDPEGLQALRGGRIDAISFASGSAARGYARLMGSDVFGAKVVCMGRLCAEEARASGLPVDAVSEGGLPELCAALGKVFSTPALP